jgi:hypothetical protein
LGFSRTELSASCLKQASWIKAGCRDVLLVEWAEEEEGWAAFAVEWVEEEEELG